MCVFCKIINKEIPAQPVYEDADTLVLADVNPQAPIHWLVIPKIHVENLTQAAPEQILACARTIQHLMREKGVAEYRTVVNTGAAAGQTVQHLHFHILSGRALGWPPG
jgi:histidine triad (HIT) family protein